MFRSEKSKEDITLDILSKDEKSLDSSCENDNSLDVNPESKIPLEIFILIFSYLPVKNIVTALSLNTFFNFNIAVKILQNNFPHCERELDIDFKKAKTFYFGIKHLENLNKEKVSVLKKLFNFIINPPTVSQFHFFSNNKTNSNLPECKKAALDLKKIILYNKSININEHVEVLYQENNSYASGQLKVIFNELIKVGLIPESIKTLLQNTSQLENDQGYLSYRLPF